MVKTEHLSTRENSLPMKLNGEGQLLKNVDYFKYLGSVIYKDDTIDRGVGLRVQAAWSSWRKLFGVLCNRKIPLKLNAKVYEVMIRAALTYGSECWPWVMKVNNKRKIANTEMRMLRGILSVETGSHAKRTNATHIRCLHR